MELTFTISADDYVKIQKWLHETVYPEVIARQKESIKDPSPIQKADWENGFPWSGASGGGTTYEFTPTGLGVVTKVLYAGGYELDISDYAHW